MDSAAVRSHSPHERLVRKYDSPSSKLRAFPVLDIKLDSLACSHAGDPASGAVFNALGRPADLSAALWRPPSFLRRLVFISPLGNRGAGREHPLVRLSGPS